MTVAESCAELAVLAPMLAPALRRDATATGTWTRNVTFTLSLYNPDVFAAGWTLAQQVPAVTMAACHHVNEPWQQRTFGTCLIALPRLDARMRNLGLVAQCRHLESITRGWVRLTKRALGLWKPDIALGVACPRCADDGVTSELYAAGAEGILQRRHGTLTVGWVHDPRIYCPAELDEDEAPHRWALGEWDHLGLVAQPLQRRDFGPIPQSASNVP
jgi:hypothetical protein